MIAKRLRPYAADLAFGLFACTYFAWLAVRSAGTPLAAQISDAAFWPLGLLIAWVNLHNARLPHVDRRSRAGWLLLAGAALALWLSGNTWTLLIRLGAANTQPGWIEWIELFQHVLALAAFFAFPNKPLHRDARLRFFADVGLTTVAGFVLAFDFVLRASGLTAGTPEYTTEVVRAFIDWATFVTATIAVSQKRDPETRAAFGCLLAANVAYLFANYFYSGMKVYHSGDAVDGLWFLAWVLRFAAARVAWHMYREGTWRPAADLSASSSEYRSSALSYFILAGAFVLLMTEIVGGEARTVDLMAVAAVAMASLLLFRQFAELRLNRRLFDAQVAQDARFRALVQQSSDVVLVVSDTGRLTYVSPSATRVFGEGCPIVAGASLRDLAPPDDPAAFDAIFGVSSASPVLQTRLRTATGEWRDLEVLWTNLTSDPAIRGIVLNCRDVTERNELERRLQHAQKIDAVGHLAGGLAHDFNNLLMVIRGYAELLRGQLPPDAEAQADLGHMEQAVDRASTVTRKLLAFSRRQAVQPTVIDLTAALTDLQPIFRQLLADGVEVRVQSDPGLWRVKADQGQIEQVIVNLMTNARDAMPRGGVLRISTSNRHVERSEGPGEPEPGDYVQLEVADSGVGMSDAIRARIFEPFFSTKPKDRGVGLGLAMVHGIVTRAGGQIRVKSGPGEGSTFTVLLPRTTEATGHAVERAAAPEPAADARTVLLVDDEPAVRDITKRLLERAGFRVIEASNGHEALAIAARPELKLDLLLTDMIMPGLDGRQVAAGFRAARPDVPVVGITGFAGDSDQDGALEKDGLAGLVTKPFSADALIRAVASACER